MELLMTTSASPRSAAHSLFVDPSEDPFLDPYIETITHTSIKIIMAMPKMNDQAFLQYLLKDGNDAVRGECTIVLIINFLASDYL